ncbi:hypothetical protein [Halorubrum halodurans]|uniref:Uncharacterized protein n=1 Tax=Halorubrum halodurans TaxID=1383851 RepID=A0A256IFA7_9EURY|nr:hypothetical protein [Halorubrum halodurans]OYR55228.1 hypothetical protein DJ70_12500 [Halorubrum halodurans]
MTRLARVLLGEAGFERAAVWSATGFALSLVAVRAAPSTGTDPVTVAAVCTAVTVLGVAGLTRVGGGLLPSVLLAYGPVAAALLELLGPRIRLVAGGGIAVDAGSAGTGGAADGPLSTVLALAEPLAIAVAGAIALGTVGFLVGRGLAAIGGTGPDAGSESRSSSTDADD